MDIPKEGDQLRNAAEKVPSRPGVRRLRAS